MGSIRGVLSGNTASDVDDKSGSCITPFTGVGVSVTSIGSAGAEGASNSSGEPLNEFASVASYTGVGISTGASLSLSSIS